MPRQPIAAISIVATGAIASPESEIPIAEMPSAIPRRSLNQLVIRVEPARAPNMAAPTASSVPIST